MEWCTNKQVQVLHQKVCTKSPAGTVVQTETPVNTDTLNTDTGHVCAKRPESTAVQTETTVNTDTLNTDTGHVCTKRPAGTAVQTETPCQHRHRPRTYKKA